MDTGYPRLFFCASRAGVRPCDLGAGGPGARLRRGARRRRRRSPRSPTISKMCPILVLSAMAAPRRRAADTHRAPGLHEARPYSSSRLRGPRSRALDSSVAPDLAATGRLAGGHDQRRHAGDLRRRRGGRGREREAEAVGSPIGSGRARLRSGRGRYGPRFSQPTPVSAPPAPREAADHATGI